MVNKHAYMSKRAFILRYGLIVKKLQSKPYSSFEAIVRYIENQMEYLQMQDDTLEIGFSKRTFQRDIREIRTLYGMNIEYSKTHQGYFISENDNESENFKRMMEAFDMYNSLNMAQGLSPYIHFEKRQPLGTENFYGLLHAIKNRLQIKFSYERFDEEGISERIADALALKEFKNRWYVLAKDKKDGQVKSFALDRLSKLEITNNRFQYPKDFSIDKTYEYCFGIISNDDKLPEEIVISMNPMQARYLKSLPLHHTHEVILDTKKETQIKLKLKITYDLILELLSYGNNLKVIKPKSLINEIKSFHEKAFKQYVKQ